MNQKFWSQMGFDSCLRCGKDFSGQTDLCTIKGNPVHDKCVTASEYMDIKHKC